MSLSSVNGETTVELNKAINSSLSADVNAVLLDHSYSIQCVTQFNTFDFNKLGDSCVLKPTEEDLVPVMPSGTLEQLQACETQLSNAINRTEMDSTDPMTPTSPTSLAEDSVVESQVTQGSIETTLSENDSVKSKSSSNSVPVGRTSSKVKSKRLSVFEVLTRRKLARLQLNRGPIDPIPFSPPEQNSQGTGEKPKPHEISSNDTSIGNIKDIEGDTPRKKSKYQKALITAPKKSYQSSSEPNHSHEKIRQSRLHELVETTVHRRTNMKHMLPDGSQSKRSREVNNKDSKNFGCPETSMSSKSIPALIPLTPQASASSPSQLSRVTIRRRKKRARKCDKCNFRYSSVNQFNRHFITHLDISPYKCMACSKSFKRADTLIEHLKEVHNSKPADALKLAKNVAAEYLLKTGEYEAEGDIDFSRIHAIVMSTALKQAKIAIPIVRRSRAIGNTAISSRNASLSVKSKSFPQDMKKNVSKDKSCPTCQKGFRHSYDLKRHLWTHLETRPFKCSICGIIKRTKWEVADHIHEDHKKSKEDAIKLANDAIVVHLKEVEMVDVPEDIPFWMVNDILLCLALKKENVPIPDGIFQNNEVFEYAQISNLNYAHVASNHLVSKPGEISQDDTSSSASNLNYLENQEDILIDKVTRQEDSSLSEDESDVDYVPDSEEEEEAEAEDEEMEEDVEEKMEVEEEDEMEHDGEVDMVMVEEEESTEEVNDD